MFIRVKSSGYNRQDEQFCNGDFLIVAQDHNDNALKPELRCLLRYAHLGEFGNFMMGRIVVGKARLVLSGCYGSDGLPFNLTGAFEAHGETRISLEYANALFSSFHPLPQELQDAFWNGGGWNDGGSEKELLRKWALKNEWLLRLRSLEGIEKCQKIKT